MGELLGVEAMAVVVVEAEEVACWVREEMEMAVSKAVAGKIHRPVQHLSEHACEQHYQHAMFAVRRLCVPLALHRAGTPATVRDDGYGTPAVAHSLFAEPIDRTFASHWTC